MRPHRNRHSRSEDDEPLQRDHNSSSSIVRETMWLDPSGAAGDTGGSRAAAGRIQTRRPTSPTTHQRQVLACYRDAYERTRRTLGLGLSHIWNEVAEGGRRDWESWTLACNSEGRVTDINYDDDGCDNQHHDPDKEVKDKPHTAEHQALVEARHPSVDDSAYGSLSSSYLYSPYVCAASPMNVQDEEESFSCGFETHEEQQMDKTKPDIDDHCERNPKSPLSAYDLFFRDERDKLLSGPVSPRDHAICSNASYDAMFEDLGEMEVMAPLSSCTPFREIASAIRNKWLSLDSKRKGKYHALAKEEMEHYRLSIALDRQRQCLERHRAAIHGCAVTPNPNVDVLCERGSRSNNNPGNRQYLIARDALRAKYKAATWQEKRQFAKLLVDSVLQRGGRFLRAIREGDFWLELPMAEALRKASQALRDVPNAAIHGCAVTPNPNVDVLCERGSRSNNNPGNRQYLIARDALRAKYKAATWQEKRQFAKLLVDSVLQRGGRFLRAIREGDFWLELPMAEALRKASQALRDM